MRGFIGTIGAQQVDEAYRVGFWFGHDERLFVRTKRTGQPAMDRRIIRSREA